VIYFSWYYYPFLAFPILTPQKSILEKAWIVNIKYQRTEEKSMPALFFALYSVSTLITERFSLKKLCESGCLGPNERELPPTVA